MKLICHYGRLRSDQRLPHSKLSNEMNKSKNNFLRKKKGVKTQPWLQPNIVNIKEF